MPARTNIRAQSVVEFAVSLPVLLVLAMGTVEIGRAFSSDEAVANGARQALRLAVDLSQESMGDTACTGNGNNPVTVTSALPPSAGSPIFTIANNVSLCMAEIPPAQSQPRRPKDFPILCSGS